MPRGLLDMAPQAPPLFLICFALHPPSTCEPPEAAAAKRAERAGARSSRIARKAPPAASSVSPTKQLQKIAESGRMLRPGEFTASSSSSSSGVAGLDGAGARLARLYMEVGVPEGARGSYLVSRSTTCWCAHPRRCQPCPPVARGPAQREAALCHIFLHMHARASMYAMTRVRPCVRSLPFARVVSARVWMSRSWPCSSSLTRTRCSRCSTR